MNRNPVFVILVFGIFLSSCSQKGLIKLITKTPKVDFPKASNFKSFSKYQKDAIYATEIIKEAYPRLYEKVPEFDKLSFEFIRKAAETTDEKYFDIEVKKFISNLNDGHSDYSIDFYKYDNTRYPLFIFKEKQNWIIGNVDKEIDSVVIGKRIISINNIPIREVEDKILKFESGENKYWKFREFLGHYNYPSYWEALNITSPKNRELKFEIENKEGISSFILNDQEKRKGYNVETKKAKYPFRFKQNSGFYDTISNNSNFAYLQMNTSLDYVSIKSEINNYTNFFTRPLALSFLKRMTKNARDFGKYLELFFKKVHEENIENLIIDLSYNTGGDERTGKQLIWYLTSQNPNGFKEFINNSEYFKTQNKEDYKKYNALYKAKYHNDLPEGETNITDKLFNVPYFENIEKQGSPFLLNTSIPKFKGNIYVIVSPTTFSAGQVLATTIADNKLAKIIGKPSGNKPTGQTGASMFKLPNTKKIISLSYIFMERPDKTKNHIDALYPDVEIHQTFTEFLNGKDPVMDYILSNSKK